MSLGEELARLAEAGIAAGRPDRRCWDCAFRRGTEPQMVQPSLELARDCFLRGEQFECHVTSGPRECQGFELAKDALCDEWSRRGR